MSGKLLDVLEVLDSVSELHEVLEFDTVIVVDNVSGRLENLCS